MLAVTAAFALLAAHARPAPLPRIVGGISVAPEPLETLVREWSDPVATRCGILANQTAAQVHGDVGDVSISTDDRGGTVWRARLLLQPEPPLVVRITCTKSRFEIGDRAYDPASPPSPLPW